MDFLSLSYQKTSCTYVLYYVNFYRNKKHSNKHTKKKKKSCIWRSSTVWSKALIGPLWLLDEWRENAEQSNIAAQRTSGALLAWDQRKEKLLTEGSYYNSYHLVFKKKKIRTALFGKQTGTLSSCHRFTGSWQLYAAASQPKELLSRFQGFMGRGMSPESPSFPLGKWAAGSPDAPLSRSQTRVSIARAGGQAARPWALPVA